MIEADCLVGSSSSTCSHCGGGASPRETAHYRLLGWESKFGDKGCGAQFVQLVSMTTYGNDLNKILRQTMKEFRPDLDDDHIVIYGETLLLSSRED